MTSGTDRERAKDGESNQIAAKDRSIAEKVMCIGAVATARFLNWREISARFAYSLILVLIAVIFRLALKFERGN